jgi:hypothetical protein
MPEPERHLIRKWQVLIAGAGTLGETELYGRSIIADARLVGKFVGPHAMVVSFEEPQSDLSLYIYAFLSSSSGVRIIRSTSYGTKVLGVRKDLLADIMIPLPNETTQHQIATLIREAVNARETSSAELRTARQVLSAMAEVKEATAMCTERKAQCLAWDAVLPTMTAWTYASTGGALPFLLRKWGGRLRDVLEADGLFNGPRFARIPVEAPHGIEFMSQRDVFLMKPVARRIMHPWNGRRRRDLRTGGLRDSTTR